MVTYRVSHNSKNRYGIEATKDDEVIESVEHLFTDELEATKFALLCNQLQLSPIHLEDVANDIVFENLHKNM